MADLAQKKGSFIRRYITAMEAFLSSCDNLVTFDTEWQANLYATNEANAITDAELQAIAPWISQEILNNAIASMEAMKPALLQQRASLEAIRS